MTNDMFRKLVKWFGLVIAGHFVAMIVYKLFLASYVAQVMQQNVTEGRMTMLFFSLIFPPVILFIKEKIASSMIEYRRLLKLAMKEEGFSVFGYYKQSFLAQDLWEIAIYAAVQLPFVLFVMIRTIPTLMIVAFIEPFYYLEYGFYMTTMISVNQIPIIIIGWLLATLYFAVVYIGLKLLFLFLAKRSIETI